MEIELRLASLSWQNWKKLGINSFMWGGRRERQAHNKLLCPFQMSRRYFCCSLQGYRANTEHWAPRWKVLQEWRIFCWKKKTFQESRCPETVETEQEISRYSQQGELGAMGIWVSLSLLGNKALAFWSRCDDSVHSRLCACSPVSLILPVRTAAACGNLDVILIFGLIFQRT